MLVKLFIISLLSVVFARNTAHDNEQKGELIFAQIIYRHGARNIDKSYKNDPWGDESNWPGGYGALINEGKREHFALGNFFRNRYMHNLLGNGEYSPKDVYVVSSEHPRTMMSAAANLAGLFPPNENQQWNKDLLWQPIPIYTPISLKNDYYLMTIPAPCERFDYLSKPFFKKFIKKNKDLVDYVEKNLNASLDIIDALRVFDALIIQSNKNMTLPEWTKKLLYPGHEIRKYTFDFFEIYTKTKELIQLKSGFLLREMMNRFVSKVNSTLVPDYKMFFYSAHDITVANVLNIFGLYDSLPTYASTIMLELNKSNEEYYVQMFYRNSTTETYSLNIPNCGAKCPLNKLYELSKSYFPRSDFKTGCLLRHGEKCPDSGCALFDLE